MIGIVAFPLWGVFDAVVAPDHVRDFVLLRLGFTVPLVGALLALSSPPGRRRPEYPTLIMLLSIEVAIALMVPRVGGELPAYALGMTLPVFAAAFLLVWSWRFTLALAALGTVALAAAWATAPDPPGASGAVTALFYVGTAYVLACVAQLHRERLAWREFTARNELEHQQERNLELVAELERLGHEDPLTGLANRRAWDQALAEAVEAARAGGHDLSLLLWDLDEFKAVNDELGHTVGDAVLVAAAGALRDGAGPDRVVARLGGDEFAVLCPGCDAGDAGRLARELRESFAARTARDPGMPLVTCSIGTASAQGQVCSATDLTLRADQSLYTDKRARAPAGEREFSG